MIASIDFAGIGQMLVGLATLITALIALRKVTAVDKAVNGKAPGERSIGSQVTKLYDVQFPPIDEDAALPLLRRIAQALEVDKIENGGTGEHPHNT